MALLDQIANPRIADVGGRFEKGRKIGEQNLTKDLAGEILNETLGSKLGMRAYTDLMKVNPEAAMNLKKALQTDSDLGTQYFLGVTKAAASIIEKGGDAKDVSRYLATQAPLALEGGRPEIAQRMVQASKALLDPNQAEEVVRNMMATAEGFTSTDGTGFSAKTVDLPGGLAVQYDNRGGVRVVDGAGKVLTGDAARKAIAAAEEAGSERKAKEVKEGADARQTASRTSEIKKEFSTRNREAAREESNLVEALRLVSKADQGITGAIKLQLGRLIPGIDTSDEAALEQALTGLALQQLQQFKGPTTDFEFGVTQSIAGELGDGKVANQARLASLSRNNWFRQREVKQFNKYIAKGGDPDQFSFNLGEKISTKRGEFTLRQIRNTAADQHMTIDQLMNKLNTGK